MSLKNYIKNDLEIRLRSGQELPAQLTLESLAEHYQVSFSPVRIALAELVEEAQTGSKCRADQTSQTGAKFRATGTAGGYV